jgi:hypothetical protein
MLAAMAEEKLDRCERAGIVLVPPRTVDAGQAWFWSDRWQNMEREAEAAITVGRIQLKPDADGTQHQLRDALILVRDVLRAHGAEAIPLWEGRDAALFIPFADAPDYPAVRAWLHAIEDAA